MKLRNWWAKEFKSIDEGRFELDDTTVLIGKNNAGKSNIIDSLTVFRSILCEGAQNKFGEEYLINKKAMGEYTIEIKFELDAEYPGLLNPLDDSLSDRISENEWLKYVRVTIVVGVRMDRSTTADIYYSTNWNDKWIGLDELSERLRDGTTEKVLKDVIEYSVESWKFIGPFREPDNSATTKFTSERLSQDGSNLIQKLHSLKNSEGEPIFDDIRESYSEIMQGVDDFDIKYKNKTEGSQTITIEVYEGDSVIHFNAEEISSGSKEILSLLTKIHLAEEDTDLLVLEEPELHLHPGAEQKIYEKIVSLVEEHNTQVIISTHSDVFVNQSDAGSIVKVERPGHTVVHGIEEDDLGMELADLGYSQSGLLQSDAVVLVEGLSDKLILSEWAANLGLDLDEEGIFIVEIEGNIDSHGRSLVKLLYSFEIPYLFIIDSDDDDSSNVINEYKRKINREDDNVDDSKIWWHTTPDHFIAWEDSDIEYFLLQAPGAIANVLGEDEDTITSIIDGADTKKNVETLRRIWEECDSGAEGTSQYQKDVHGRLIAKNMGQAELDDEALDAMEAMRSLVTSN